MALSSGSRPRWASSSTWASMPSSSATNISPNVRGSMNRSWPPWVKVMTTWVCLAIASLVPAARRSWPDIPRGITSTSPPLAPHPGGDPQPLPAVELDEQVLAPSLDAHELLADQRLGELLALPVTTDRAHPRDVDGLRRLADALLLEISPDPLDLRELRPPAPPLPRSAPRPPTPVPTPLAP